ncbi:actin-like ATPase domain-containing protein [Aspergillus egyptiacus]|nr:actin-like ATPase domain-containing protein [Aspergillus egyptiacus]
MQGPAIVVGIDFGTTFSGVAWALQGSTDDIEVLTSWPGAGNRTSVKVPSTISYTSGSLNWGYQIGPLTEACRGIKLLFDEDPETEYSPSVASKPLLTKYGKDVVQVAADYMRQLVRQVGEVILRRLGVALEKCSLQFVLTVPAVWSDKAKDATLRAAVQAGICERSLSLVAEPEAAALYVMRGVREDFLAVNDVFIVCDAGGGTVDLISYMVKSTEPLSLVEVTKGTSRMCGSTLLDQRFEEILRERMGFENYKALSKKSKEDALKYWQDRVKPNFAGKFDDEEGDFADVDYHIPVRGAKDDPEVKIEKEVFRLNTDEIEAIFDPIVQEIEELVTEQRRGIARAGLVAEAILLVGGFGASDYLFRRLQEANPMTTILQPPNSWSAIVSGAVHHGLEGNKVHMRIARRHYGVQANAKWNPRLHSESQKWLHPLVEEYYVRGQMSWFIYKDSPLSENTPIKLPFFRAVELSDPDGLVFRDRLYFCNADAAPGGYGDGRANKTSEVTHLCNVEADLSTIPRELFEKRTNSKGVQYWYIPFMLAVTPGSAALVFELEFNGASYGSVKTRY